MENTAVSFSSIPSEGTSQIFVTQDTNTDTGFKKIFASQSGTQTSQHAGSGTPLQADGNNAPPSQSDGRDVTKKDGEDLPVFVDPPEGATKAQATETAAEQIAIPGFQGEAYPASDLFPTPATPGELYTLTDADLAEPDAAATVANKPETSTTDDTATPAGLAELASLQSGDYSEAVVTTAPDQVEIAALTTKPFVQPIPATGETSTPVVPHPAATPVTPATGSISLNSADNATLSTAEALQAAVKNAATGQDAAPTVTASDKASDNTQVTPATSSGFIHGEKLADARQIQAYTEAMVARANDGSVPGNQTTSSTPGIDIAALNTRMEQASSTGASSHLQQAQISPHTLNFREKGWESSFGQNIMWMANKDIKSAQVHIKPAELGPIHIELSMHKDQMTLQINATHHLARDTLEAALPRLRAELSNQGFSDASINVGSQTKDGSMGGQGNASSMDQQPQSDQPAENLIEDHENIVPATSAMNLMSGTAALLDTFA